MIAGRYLGLMSGTSADAIDAALVEVSPDAIRLLATHRTPMPATLRARIRALEQPGAATLEAIGQLDALLGDVFGNAARAAIETAGVPAASIRAIGSHGQTISHRPCATPPYTLQIGDPNRIAELTGLATVADFRRRDVAAGGQGAPLVPMAHGLLFASDTEPRAIVNVGGMANITLLGPGPRNVLGGFDTGPGNVLMDAWHERLRGTAYDRDGAFAAAGRPAPDLLAAMLDDPYFAMPAPKSTGREDFDLRWLERHLAAHSHADPADVQATLAELTAVSIAQAIVGQHPQAARVILCGGGAHNAHLRARLAHHLGHRPLETSDQHGIDPDWVEAVAFALLAALTLAGIPGNCPQVTGARHPVVLGAIHHGA